MARGKAATVGDTRVSKNGYHYTKVADHPLAPNGWILTHWLTAEKKLGRQLNENESVRFKDQSYKSKPYDMAGIVIVKKKTSSLRKRLAVVEDRIRELTAEKEYIEKELAKL